MRISEEDLNKLFQSDHDSVKTEIKGDKIILKKVKSTSEITKVRKTLRRVETKKNKSDFSELINSILRFLAISGFSGFILFLIMSWSGISKQLEWGYYVSYLNENIPTINATSIPRPEITRKPNEPALALPGALPELQTIEQNKLKIERINLSAPVIWDVEEENILEQLKNGVAHYKGTSLPGQGGNVFIVGHSSNYFWIKSDYNNIFALLDKLSPGDRIELSTADKRYVYEVKTTNIVKPDEVKVLESTPKETLSLMTCWPIGTSLKRMLVQSELLYSSK